MSLEVVRAHDQPTGCPAERRRSSAPSTVAGVLVALPAMFLSLGLVLVLTDGLGRLQMPALLLWLSVPALGATRAGERVAVRASWRCRAAAGRERVELASRAAEASGGRADPDIDWYVVPGTRAGVFAVGRRSVVLTETALQEMLAGRLTGDPLARLLATASTRNVAASGFAMRWLASPYLYASRAVVRTAAVAAGRRRLGQPTRLVATVGGLVALLQAVQQRHWAAAAVLALIGSDALSRSCGARSSRTRSRQPTGDLGWR